MFTENLMHNVDAMSVDFGTNVSHITNYENYFDKDTATKKDIFNVIKDFQKYYNDRKIEMLYIHKDNDFDVYDIIREYRDYYQKKC